MDTYDENGERKDADGNVFVDPTHPAKLTDPRYNLVRNKWAKSHGASQMEEASANAER